jgi:transposase
MDMDYLEATHFPSAYKPVGSLNQLAQQIFEKIRLEPWTTTDLRNEISQETGCSKSQFDTALKRLQISLNIVRACDAEQDTWLAFEEVYAEIWNEHVPGDT